MNNFYLNNFYNYLETQKRYSVNTISAYKRDLSLFFEYIKKEAITEISCINIQTYLSSLYLQQTAMTTISRKLSAIKSYGKYLHKYYNIDCSFLNMISLPKKEKKLPEYLRKEDMEKLLNMPLNSTLEIRNALLISLLYSSGIRLSELTNLKVSDFNSHENVFRVKGKGNKHRLVVYSNHTKYLLQLYLKSRLAIANDYLFLNKNSEKLTNRGVELILENISKKFLGHNKLHPHMLRHTYASKLLNEGMDLRTLQQLLGHKSLNATQVYTHISKNELSDFYTTFHPRGDNEGL